MPIDHFELDLYGIKVALANSLWPHMLLIHIFQTESPSDLVTINQSTAERKMTKYVSEPYVFCFFGFPSTYFIRAKLSCGNFEPRKMYSFSIAPHQVTRQTVARLHFGEATDGNARKPRSLQRHFQLLVVLTAVLGHQRGKVAVQAVTSEPTIVRVGTFQPKCILGHATTVFSYACRGRIRLSSENTWKSRAPRGFGTTMARCVTRCEILTSYWLIVNLF